MYREDTTAPLLARARTGESAAIEALLEAATPAVRRFVELEMPARFRSVLSTDDVLQQTFVDAFRDVSHFAGDSPAAFERWLLSIARRNLVDTVRCLEAEKRGGKGRARLPLDLEASCAALYDELAGGTRPSQALSRDETARTLRHAVAALPEEYRRCVQAFDLEGRAMDDVAAALGRSKGACYMIRTRAHRILREILGKSSKFF